MRRGSRTYATWEHQPSFPWTSSAEASPARTSAARASELASLVLEAASGTSSLASLQRCARGGSSSRTSPAEPASGSTPCAESWNGSATQRYRSRLRQLIAEHPTSEHAFSSSLVEGCLLPTLYTVADRSQKLQLPTLTAHGYGSQAKDGRTRYSLRRLVPMLTTTRAQYMTSRGKRYPMLNGMVDGPLSPRWLEWFMGFPDGWITSVP